MIRVLHGLVGSPSWSCGCRRSRVEGQFPAALPARRRPVLRPSGPPTCPAPAEAAFSCTIMVGLERELAESAFGAPAAEARHQGRAVKLVLYPPPHRAAIAPHRREEVASLCGALPDSGLQATLDGASFLEGAVQVLAKLRFSVLGAAELGEHEQGRHRGCNLPRTREILAYLRDWREFADSRAERDQAL